MVTRAVREWRGVCAPLWNVRQMQSDLFRKRLSFCCSGKWEYEMGLLCFYNKKFIVFGGGKYIF